MVTVVVSEINERYVIIPIPFEVDHTIPQHIDEGQDSMRCLSIHERMKTVLKFSFEPKSFWKEFQNCAVNCAPLSEIMETGTP